jgi:hypothetical protein
MIGFPASVTNASVTIDSIITDSIITRITTAVVDIVGAGLTIVASIAIA